jgi:hypothetical protein
LDASTKQQAKNVKKCALIGKKEKLKEKTKALFTASANTVFPKYYASPIIFIR